MKTILFALSTIVFFISWGAPVFNLGGLAHAELSFTDITESAGTGGPTGTDELGGHGVMFCDVDVDGRPDLYITMNWNTGVIYRELFFRNNGGNIFSGEAAERGIDDLDGGSHGACWADLDNDGDYDLFNGTTRKSSGDPDGNDVFRNDGGGYFTDVTPDSITGRQEYTRGVLTFDMDADGDLDLFGVSGYLGTDDGPDDRNEVYRNEGDFSFTPITSGALYVCPAGQGAVDTDFDGDGDIDVIAANRTGPVNILLNDGSGSFTLVSPSSIGITQGAGDGITTADVDNDGDLDMLLAGNDIGHLYLNNGSGTFSFKRDFSSTDGFMGGFADLDNDGDMDLVFAGDNLVYLNDGNGNFSAGPAVPVSGINDPRAIAFADIDDDGDMDFAIGVKRSRNWLVRNNFNTGMWLKVKLLSPQGQAGAFGAKVRIYPAWEAGGVLLGMRESRSNSGYLGQDDPVLHFGLGSHESVDVEVEFLDGVIVPRTYVAANQTITIDGGLPDSDGDGLSDDLENTTCTDPNDADTDDDGIPDGREDANKNGVVDSGETSPCDIDSDDDNIQDGTEAGYTLDDIGPDTDTGIFQPDLDPSTTTDPLNPDTDGDGLLDGEEDTNYNGRLDPGETDPLPALAQVDISHTYRGDLIVDIGVGDPDSPDWVTRVWDGEGGSANDLDLDVNVSEGSSYLPPSAGNRWFLKVYDKANGNQGSIDVFSITHDGETYTSADPPVAITDNNTCYAYIEGVLPGDELAVDFGTNGLWHYSGSSWTHLAAWDPGPMEEWNGGLAVDFGANGLWHYSGSSWTHLAAWDPGPMEEWNGGLAVDFGTNGLWHYSGSSWTHLAAWNPISMEEWAGGLAVDFGATNGLWSYNGSSWTHLSAWNPGHMEAYGTGLAIDFGSNGLWNYDGSSWTNLAAWDPGTMEEWAGGLAVDFGATNGLWSYNGSSWTNLAAWDPGYMEAYGTGLAIDFASNGLWYYNGSSWTHLSAWNPTTMEYWAGGLAVDFASNGLWNYYGSSWTHLSAWNPGDIIGIDLY